MCYKQKTMRLAVIVMSRQRDIELGDKTTQKYWAKKDYEKMALYCYDLKKKIKTKLSNNKE